jgi:hypothetical protein
MTGKKPEQTKAPSAAHELDETEPIQDLEIDNAEQAEAVKGGSISGGGGAGAGKVTFNPFSITR